MRIFLMKTSSGNMYSKYRCMHVRMIITKTTVEVKEKRLPKAVDIFCTNEKSQNESFSERPRCLR